MAWSQPILTIATTLIVGAVGSVILGTVGQAAAAEARVIAAIDEAGTRTIVVTDPTGRGGLDPQSVEQALALHGVAWAVGLGAVEDVRNIALGDAARPVPARPYYGSLPAEMKSEVANRGWAKRSSGLRPNQSSRRSMAWPASAA